MIITFSYFLRNFSTTSCFEGNSILYNFMSRKNVQKCFIWKLWIKTLQVLFKVNKKSTFCFEDILSMVIPIKVKQKTLFRGLLEHSKKSKNSKKCGKLSKLHHSQVGEFWKNAQREMLLKIKFFANGLTFSSSKLVPYTIRNIQAQCHEFLFYFSI